MSCSPVTAGGGATSTSSIPSVCVADVEELLVAMRPRCVAATGSCDSSAVASRYAAARAVEAPTRARTRLGRGLT